MGKGFFDDIDFDIDCPHCNKKITIKADQVGSTVTCRYCKNKITLKDSGFKSGIKSANKSMHDLDKALNSIKFK